MCQILCQSDELCPIDAPPLHLNRINCVRLRPPPISIGWIVSNWRPPHLNRMNCVPLTPPPPPISIGWIVSNWRPPPHLNSIELCPIDATPHLNRMNCVQLTLPPISIGWIVPDWRHHPPPSQSDELCPIDATPPPSQSDELCPIDAAPPIKCSCNFFFCSRLLALINIIWKLPLKSLWPKRVLVLLKNPWC